MQPFNAWFPLKGYKYLNKPDNSRKLRVCLSMYGLLVDNKC